MQENNYKIKPSLNTKKIIGHQRLYLDKNSSHSSKALGKKTIHAAFRKEIKHFFLKKKKRDKFVIKPILTITASIVYLNHNTYTYLVNMVFQHTSY